MGPADLLLLRISDKTQYNSMLPHIALIAKLCSAAQLLFSTIHWAAWPKLSCLAEERCTLTVLTTTALHCNSTFQYCTALNWCYKLQCTAK